MRASAKTPRRSAWGDLILCDRCVPTIRTIDGFLLSDVFVCIILIMSLYQRKATVMGYGWLDVAERESTFASPVSKREKQAMREREAVQAAKRCSMCGCDCHVAANCEGQCLISIDYHGGGGYVGQRRVLECVHGPIRRHDYAWREFAPVPDTSASTRGKIQQSRYRAPESRRASPA